VISPAQREQRRAAALQHGAYAETRIRPTVRARWTRLRKSLNRSGVRIREASPRAWQQLHLLVRYLVLMELAEVWLEAQRDAIFADVTTGALHPLVERYTGWIASASDIVSKLPAELVNAAENDLSRALSKHHMGGAHR
jgi:hypothetical protein